MSALLRALRAVAGAGARGSASLREALASRAGVVGAGALGGGALMAADAMGQDGDGGG